MFFGHCSEGLGNGLVLPTPILGHRYVRREFDPEVFLEHPPVVFPDPRGVAVLLQARRHRLMLLRCRQEAAVRPGEVDQRQETGRLTDHGERVARHLLAALHRLVHLRLHLPLGKAVDARLLVSHHRAEPCAHVVRPARQVVDAAGHDALQRGVDLRLGVLIQLLAVLHRPAHPAVVALEQLGVREGLAYLVEHHGDGCL